MDASDQPRVVLLGYGYWGPNLARNLHLRLGRGWVACVDPDPARRAEVAHRYPWVRPWPTRGDARGWVADGGVERHGRAEDTPAVVADVPPG